MRRWFCTLLEFQLWPYNLFILRQYNKLYKLNAFSTASDVLRVTAINMPQLLQIILLRENTDCIFSSVTVNANTNIADTQSTTASSPQGGMCSKSTSSSSLELPKSNTKDRWGHDTPVLTAKTKMFEIRNINNVVKVCLFYESTGTNNPKIYILDLKTFQWQFLADTFTEYLRMAIAHLGLPYWELCFSNIKMPPWTEQLYLILAPHLLNEHTERRGHLIDPRTECHQNEIDPNVFKVRPKTKTQISVTKLASRRSMHDNKNN